MGALCQKQAHAVWTAPRAQRTLPKRGRDDLGIFFLPEQVTRSYGAKLSPQHPGRWSRASFSVLWWKTAPAPVLGQSFYIATGRMILACPVSPRCYRDMSRLRQRLRNQATYLFNWLFGLVAWFSLRVREVLGSIPRTALCRRGFPGFFLVVDGEWAALRLIGWFWQAYALLCELREGTRCCSLCEAWLASSTQSRNHVMPGSQRRHAAQKHAGWGRPRSCRQPQKPVK